MMLTFKIRFLPPTLTPSSPVWQVQGWAYANVGNMLYVRGFLWLSTSVSSDKTTQEVSFVCSFWWLGRAMRVLPNESLDMGDANELPTCDWAALGSLQLTFSLSLAKESTGYFLNQFQLKPIPSHCAMSFSYKYPSFPIVVSLYNLHNFRIMGNPNAPRVLSFYKYNLCLLLF